jgi:selenocysteine lyase/cysteine desulfurase
MFPVTKNWNYLVTGANAPLAKSVYEKSSRYLGQNLDEGFKHYSSIPEIINEPKTLFAQLVNCDESELALIPNSTHGINLVAQMIHPQKGDNVVIGDLEYHGSAYPWLKSALDGVDVRVAKSEYGRLPIENIEKLVDDRTKVISIAHVCHSGYRQDLRSLSKLAHDHGALMISDSIGSCGIINVDAKESQVDFLTTSSYKWLLGLQGAGFLFVRRKLIESFVPPDPGAQATPGINSADVMVSPSWDKIRFPKSAARFETGMPSIISAVSLSASIKLLLDIGVQNIEKRVSDLTQYAIEKIGAIDLEIITPIERKLRGGHIIVFMKKKRAEDIYLSLFKKKIHVQRFVPSYGPKFGALFVAPDFFNNEEEIDALVRQLKLLIYN